MTDEERHLGELMKATKVAICHFLAKDPSSMTEPDSMRQEAESIRAYRISSKRHLYAMRAELDSTVRDLRRQVSLGNWPQRSYQRLVEHLRGEELIDISTWVDSDAERVKKILERGVIRTVAEWRLATEYRDFAEPEFQERVDELLESYQIPTQASRLEKPRNGSGRKRSLSSEGAAFVDLLRRSAIAGFEYAAHRETRAETRAALEDRAKTWRTIEFTEFRSLREFERAFWVCMVELRRLLSETDYRALAARFKEQGLMDVSDVSPRGPSI